MNEGMRQEDLDRLNLIHATEAYATFTQWAREVKKRTKHAEMPALVIYEDGSGFVGNLLTGKRYCEFRSFPDLIEKL